MHRTMDEAIADAFLPAPRLMRRLIPVGVALTLTGLALYPALTDMVTESEWLRWSLLLLAGMFLFKTMVFTWMRQTMVDQTRRLTVFGCALVDFFTAIVVCDLLLVYLFFTGYLAAREGRQTASFTVRVMGRSGLVGGVSLVLGTGFAVAWEMRRAKGHVRVHVEEVENADGGSERDRLQLGVAERQGNS